MSNQKSIIGRGYIPRGVLAVCLKTNSDTNLGEVEYKIIHDPYERIFEDRRVFAALTPRRQKLMAVNVASFASIARVDLMMDTNNAAGSAIFNTSLLSPCR